MNAAISFHRGNDMKSFAVAGVNDFFAGVPAVHEDVNLFVILNGKSFNDL